MMRTVASTVFATLLLAGCGQGDHDPSADSAPAAAVSDDHTSSQQTVATDEPTQSYREANEAAVTPVVGNAPQTDPLARCQGLDSMQRDSCELQVRQELAGATTSPAPAMQPTDTQSTDVPTDTVPPATDATAAQDDDD